ncbi:hypothetical protein ACFQ2Y_03700 [Streptomyces malaysiensis subsp. malaysiensis]
MDGLGGIGRRAGGDPSPTAALTTAAAVTSEDSRRLATGGSREAPGCVRSTWSATA